LLKQANEQRRAAGARPIEWHFAEPSVAAYVNERFAYEGVNIIVIYMPPPWAEP